MEHDDTKLLTGRIWENLGQSLVTKGEVPGQHCTPHLPTVLPREPRPLPTVVAESPALRIAHSSGKPLVPRGCQPSLHRLTRRASHLSPPSQPREHSLILPVLHRFSPISQTSLEGPKQLLLECWSALVLVLEYWSARVSSENHGEASRTIKSIEKPSKNHWKTIEKENSAPEDSKHPGSGRIESASKSTTFSM